MNTAFRVISMLSRGIERGNKKGRQLLMYRYCVWEKISQQALQISMTVP